MDSLTKDELQAMNMTALKALPQSQGGRTLNKDPLIEYILNDTWAKTQAAEAAAAAEGSGPQPGDDGTVTFGLVQGLIRIVVLSIKGRREEVRFENGIYTTDNQDVVDALYNAGYNPVSEATDDRPPKPTL